MKTYQIYSFFSGICLLLLGFFNLINNINYYKNIQVKDYSNMLLENQKLIYKIEEKEVKDSNILNTEIENLNKNKQVVLLNETSLKNLEYTKEDNLFNQENMGIVNGNNAFVSR